MKTAFLFLLTIFSIICLTDSRIESSVVLDIYDILPSDNGSTVVPLSYNEYVGDVPLLSYGAGGNGETFLEIQNIGPDSITPEPVSVALFLFGAFFLRFAVKRK